MQKCGMQDEGVFYDADFEGIGANRYRYEIHKTDRNNLQPT